MTSERMKVHLWGRPETAAEVQADDDGSAAARYCHEHVSMSAGDVAIVVLPKGLLRRVKCFGNGTYYSRIVTEEAVRQFLASVPRMTNGMSYNRWEECHTYFSPPERWAPVPSVPCSPLWSWMHCKGAADTARLSPTINPCS